MESTPNLERNRRNIIMSALLASLPTVLGSMPGYQFIYVFLLSYIAFNVSDIANMMLKGSLDRK